MEQFTHGLKRGRRLETRLTCRCLKNRKKAKKSLLSTSQFGNFFAFESMQVKRPQILCSQPCVNCSGSLQRDQLYDHIPHRSHLGQISTVRRRSTHHTHGRRDGGRYEFRVDQRSLSHSYHHHLSLPHAVHFATHQLTSFMQVRPMQPPMQHV